MLMPECQGSMLELRRFPSSAYHIQQINFAIVPFAPALEDTVVIRLFGLLRGVAVDHPVFYRWQYCMPRKPFALNYVTAPCHGPLLILPRVGISAHDDFITPHHLRRKPFREEKFSVISSRIDEPD